MLENSAISASQKWCKVTLAEYNARWASIHVSVKFLLSLFFCKAKHKSAFNKGIMFFKSGLLNIDMRTVITMLRHTLREKVRGKNTREKINR